MIVHTVLFKAKKGENIEKAMNLLKGMESQIEEILSIEVGENLVDSFHAWDFALIARFENMQTFEIYCNHPLHKPVADYVHSMIESSACVDFEI